MKFLPLILAVSIVMLGVSLAVWPQIDLAISGHYFSPDKKFIYESDPFFVFLHNLAYWGARGLGGLFAFLAVIAYFREAPVGGVGLKGWLFLLLALIVGPVLIANIGLKDHWGRARPREITEFGGERHFSPYWQPQAGGHKNDSFVAGDPSFGFYLTALAFLVPLQDPKTGRKTLSSRLVFWACIGFGGLFGLARIVMGAHFFSDVFFACILMQSANFAVYGAMYGMSELVTFGRNWFFLEECA